MATKKSKKPAKPTSKTRKLKTPQYKSFRLTKKIKSSQPKLPSSWAIFKNSYRVMRKNWKFFAGVVLIYGFLSLLFVRSSGSPVDVVGLKESFQTLFGQGGEASSSVALFGLLLGSASAGGDIAGLYQLIIGLIVSLATIFGLRVIFADGPQKPSVKKSFYEGMTPLIPVILVLLVIGLQLLPFSIGSGLYVAVVNGGIAVTTIEKIFWLVLLMLLALLSLYMVASSIFALYIVSLPQMTPMKALRGARELVRYRRWMIMRRLIVLPLVLLIAFGLVVIPLIAFLPAIAELTFFVLTIVVLPFVHTYIYGLYRKML